MKYCSKWIYTSINININIIEIPLPPCQYVRTYDSSKNLIKDPARAVAVFKKKNRLYIITVLGRRRARVYRFITSCYIPVYILPFHRIQ